MLRWFVDMDMQGPKKLIEEEDVEVRPDCIPNAVLDDNVDIHLIRKYFSNDAWLQVVDVVKQKQSKATPYIYASVAPMIFTSFLPLAICDHCLTWFHIHCVGLKQSPKSHYWFCRGCHESPLS